MQSLEEIRHRVKSIKDIRHITKAMNMLSAIRIRQAEGRIADARPFAQRINEGTCGYCDIGRWKASSING